MLRERMEQDLGYEASMEAFLRRKPKKLKKKGRYPSREEIHERDVLR
jgi:hypothetical protein